MGRAGRRGLQWLLTLLFVAAASSASAEPIKCQRTIAKASAKFAKDKSKALQKCEDKKVSGDLAASTDCHLEPKTFGAIQKAETKLGTSISKDCGGADKTCGTPDDDPLSAIGWDGVPACPNFENGSCNAPITDCSGIAICVACVDEAAVDQAITLYYGDLASGEFGSKSAINKCQRAIGKETTKFLQSKAKALQKCWDARLKGKHTAACPTPGDGKAGPAIEKAEAKKVQNICKACGGADKACGGGDDLTPGQIGFASTCPDVTVPEGGSSCGGALLDLGDVVECVDCVTEFKVDCMERLAVPQFVPYPPECNEAPSTSTSTTSTTSTSSSTTTTEPGLCGNGVVDPSEPCDPSSPGGVFLCGPGEQCTEVCTCEPTATTTTPTSSTTTTTMNLCGNGVVDPSEPCDPSSPGGVFLCGPGEQCSAHCTCESTSTTTTSSTGTTSTTTSSTTSTTLNLCGNGVVDPSEPCDPSSPGGVFLCEPGEQCSVFCTCEHVSTTTTSSAPPTTAVPTTTEPTTSSTSSTSEPPTTTSTSTSTTTTTTPPYGSPSQAFVVRLGTLLE